MERQMGHLELKRIDGTLAFSGEYESMRDLVIAAVKVRADLRGAHLQGADLRGAYLQGADLRDVKAADLVIAQTVITPQGSLIVWKKCRNNILVKLRVPEEALRSSASGRKCRAEFVDVLELIGGEVGISLHDGQTEYRVGQRVTCDKWCEDRWTECGGGIHFMLTREEAEAFSM